MQKKNLGLILVFLWSLNLAAQNVDSLKQILKTAKDDSTRARIETNIAKVYLYHDNDSAKYYANNAIQLAKKINNKKMLANGYLLLGSVYSFIGDYPTAKSTLTEAKNICIDLLKEEDLKASEIKNVTMILIRAYRILGNTVYGSNEIGEAIDFFEKALLLAQSINDTRAIADSYAALSTCYYNLRKYPESIKYAYESIKICEANHYPLGGNYANLASIYLIQKEYKKALEKYNLALDQFKLINKQIDVATTLNNIAKTYAEQKENNKALDYFKEALVIMSKEDFKQGLVNTYYEISSLYFGQEKYDEALPYLEKSLVTAREIQFDVFICSDLTRMGEIYTAQNKFSDANKALNEALTVAKKTNDYEMLMLCYRALYELNSKQNNYKYALENYKNYRTYSDSMYNKETQEKLIRSELNYEAEKKEALAKTEKEKLDVQLAAEQKQKKIVSFALAIIFILFLLAYINMRRTNKLNKVIGQQKSELEDVNKRLGVSLAQKETLLKEIHHRVKNNLQVISGLLSLQSNNSKNQEVISVMSEGRNRIKSMALIHQMLYQHEDISEVNFNKYVMQLTKEISSSYNNKDLPVVFKIQSDDVSFNIDTAIPLGLIISELVSNSIKYAYTGKGGVVNINLARIENGMFILTVTDYGKGLPKDFNIETSSSLGMKLVKMLCLQLRATLEIDSSNGTSVSMKFKPEIKHFN